MILNEEVPFYGTLVVGFKLASEIRNSKSPIIEEAFEKISKHILDITSKNELGGLKLIPTSQLTQRTVIGEGIGDSRISELIMEFNYFKLYPATINNFSRLLNSNLSSIGVEKKFFSGVSLKVRVPEDQKMPKTGFIVITATFSGFEQSMQNDSRKKMKLIEQKIKNNKVNIVPVSWSILRGRVLENKSTVGAQSKFSVIGMDYDKFQMIKKLVEKERANLKIWSNVNVEYETDILGVE